MVVKKRPLSTGEAIAKSSRFEKRAYESVYKTYVKYSPRKKGTGIKRLERSFNNKPGKKLKNMTAAEKGKIIVKSISPHLYSAFRSKKRAAPGDKELILDTKGVLKTWKNNKQLWSDLQAIKKTTDRRKGITEEHRKQAMLRAEVSTKLKSVFLKTQDKIVKDLVIREGSQSKWPDMRESFIQYIIDTEIYDQMHRELDMEGLTGKERQDARKRVYDKLTKKG